MANEPSAVGMIILTGMTIAAVVGLYAYDVIPRRDGIMPDTNVAWPRWQSNDAAPPEPVQSQSTQPPAYSQQPTYPYDQQQYPQQEQNGYGPPQQGNQQNQPSQYPQDQRGQVPDDQQGSDAGAGQPPPPDYSQRQ